MQNVGSVVIEEVEKRGNVEEEQGDVMQIDEPSESVTMEGVMKAENVDVVHPAISPMDAPSSAVQPSLVPVASAVMSLKSQSPSQPTDTEMTDADAHLSLVHLSAVPGSSPSLHYPSPFPKSPITIASPKSPIKSIAPFEPTKMEDILGESKASPPSDPLLQAKEVAAGLAIETPTEHAEYTMDAGNLSGAGGGIAGEGIVGGGTEDLEDLKEGVQQIVPEIRTNEEEQILEATKKDLRTDIVENNNAQD